MDTLILFKPPEPIMKKQFILNALTIEDIWD